MNISYLPKIAIFDVDGVLTTGSFLYSIDGKVLKIFGPDDNDGLKLLEKHMKIIFVTGDKRGFKISKKRICEDMDFPLFLVSTFKRIDWIQEKYDLKDVIYMGDGIFDHYVMRKVGYSIAPRNSDKLAKQSANYVTERAGGDRAVAEACLHIMDKFFEPYNPLNSPKFLRDKKSNEWTS